MYLCIAMDSEAKYWWKFTKALLDEELGPNVQLRGTDLKENSTTDSSLEHCDNNVLENSKT
jgi:hypothetical protein